MSRVYVGGLRHPVEKNKIVALLERAKGVEKVRDVELREGGNPLEQDCYMFAVVEPPEAADVCVKTYNKCKWRKLTLKVEKTKRGPFTLDMLKTPQGFEATRKRTRPEAEIRPTLSSKPLRIRRKEGQRGMVHVAPDKSNHFGDLDSDSDSDSDDEAASDAWAADFTEIKRKEPAAAASPAPLEAERVAAVRARLDAFENGTQYMSDDADSEAAKALDSENTQLLGVLSSLLQQQQQQQATQPATTEEEELAAAYGIRKERPGDGPTAGGEGVVNFLDDETADHESATESKEEASDGDQADAPLDDNHSKSSADDEEEEAEEKQTSSNEDAYDEQEDASSGDDDAPHADAPAGGGEDPPKTKLRSIFEDFLSNKDQASSFSLFGGSFGADDASVAQNGAAEADQDAPSTDAAPAVVPAIVPASQTFKVADTLAAVDRAATRRWQVHPADLFKRRDNYEEEWLATQGDISRVFRSRAKMAKRLGLGRS